MMTFIKDVKIPPFFLDIIVEPMQIVKNINGMRVVITYQLGRELHMEFRILAPQHNFIIMD
jgi:hypothetical protein